MYLHVYFESIERGSGFGIGGEVPPSMADCLFQNQGGRIRSPQEHLASGHRFRIVQKAFDA